MDQLHLAKVETVEQLANELGYTYDKLSSLLYGPTSTSNYRVFQVAKRLGGYRTIAAPRPELKAIQWEILEALTQAYKPTRSAFGFVPGRSIVLGAQAHCHKRVIVNLDLADFFPSISFRRVRGLFMSSAFGLPYEVATVVAQICSRAGRLPQGAPTSPIISNFICSAMDRDIGALVGAVGGRYSRYCDDLTMSFDSEVMVFKSIAKKGLKGLVLNASIENIIKKHGFNINYSKLKLRTRRERQEVTGLIVNEKVNVRRELIKRLHTQLHCVEKFGLKNAATKYCEISGSPLGPGANMHFAAALRGRINFVKQVRGNGDQVFANLAKRFNRLEIHPKKIKYFKKVQSVADLKRALWVVEADYDDPDWGYCGSQGTAFLLEGVGFITCAHVVINDQSKRPFRDFVIFRTGSSQKYRAFVASYDPKTDLAILYVEGIDYYRDCDVRFALSRIDQANLGQAVQMVGFPSYRDGQSPFVSATEIAAIHGDLMEVGGQVIGGISGGPLLDAEFRVLGVLTRGVPGGGAKNEAISAKKAFRLNFKYQNLGLLESGRLPPSREAVSTWGKIRVWVRSIMRRFLHGR